jgi:hypothetical protein
MTTDNRIDPLHCRCCTRPASLLASATAAATMCALARGAAIDRTKSRTNTARKARMARMYHLTVTADPLLSSLPACSNYGPLVTISSTSCGHSASTRGQVACHVFSPQNFGFRSAALNNSINRPHNATANERMVGNDLIGVHYHTVKVIH